MNLSEKIVTDAFADQCKKKKKVKYYDKNKDGW